MIMGDWVTAVRMDLSVTLPELLQVATIGLLRCIQRCRQGCDCDAAENKACAVVPRDMI
jgi:hypothetical protein